LNGSSKKDDLETIKIIRHQHQLQRGPYKYRNWGMHGVEVWHHRTGGSWSDWGPQFFDASAVCLVLILIFFALEPP